MYKPPQNNNNNNRVKLIRKKFENNDDNNENKNEVKSNLIDKKSLLQRQTSDPIRRNIKRTPAFRVDTSIERPKNSLYQSKIKFTNCDNNNKNDDKQPLLLVKSRSSIDFNYNNNKSTNVLDVSMLYTEPIPKALRNNNLIKNDDIYNANTIKIDDKLQLTDTLKLALSKPLPKGPAPKKPPRTFQNSSINDDTTKNQSFLHKKTDHKYMLNKLEDALRNNKLRTKKMDISGDDSDDSLLSRNRTLPKPPQQDYNNGFNFNCLNGLKFAMTNYEKIKEPNSCFFVSNPVQNEPVYAEPYHFRKDFDGIKRDGIRESSRSKQSARNSLYYMSTPILNGDKFINNMTESPDKQLSAENSSLSSFTSDAETSSPIEDQPNIKNIIENYESKNTNRVDDLKKSLTQTLDKSFNNICAIKDNPDSENDSKVSDIIKKFETYRQTMPKYSSIKIRTEKLFYCCLIIEKVGDVARIKYKYPHNAEIPQSIESLCFPESDITIMDNTNLSQNYSLLITNEKGERTFGYCRRVLPEGSLCCLPLAYCILSKYRAPRFYKKILVELESRHGIPTKFRDELISQFYQQSFPKPGESIKINLANIEPNIYKTEQNFDKNFEDSIEVESFVHVNRTGEYIAVKKNIEDGEQIFVNGNDIKKNCSVPSYITQTKGKNELILTLHPDIRFEDSDLTKLHQLPEEVILKLFSSLLLERKVILISSIISKLSSCIDSLQSILYPFTWHHTCIPILPESLWDIVESPTPVICGVLSNKVLDFYEIENGIVVDLDSGTVKKEEGDENKILSNSLQKIWKRSLTLANRASNSLEYVQSVYLSDAYLQVFIMYFKDYKRFFRDGLFQKEEFLKSARTRSVKRFLKMFLETYMFMAFVETVTTSPESLVEFDKKIEMYGSEDSNIILDKLLEWNK